MGAAVLLLHEDSGAGIHFDWLIERPGGDALITFRVLEAIDRAGVQTFDAVRIGDHRREYLRYEGPISGERGVVTRVADGHLTVLEDSPERFAAAGQLGMSVGTFEGRLVTGDRWRFVFVAAGVAR